MAEERKIAGRKAIEEVLAALTFDQDGLIGAVAQQFDTGEVLMFAWMDRAIADASPAWPFRVLVNAPHSRLRRGPPRCQVGHRPVVKDTG